MNITQYIENGRATTTQTGQKLVWHPFCCLDDVLMTASFLTTQNISHKYLTAQFLLAMCEPTKMVLLKKHF